VIGAKETGIKQVGHGLILRLNGTGVNKHSPGRLGFAETARFTGRRQG
jgi:hypothetical protein